MDADADARIDADRADVRAPAAVAVDKVDGVLRAGEQGVEIPVQALLLPEHAAEVVAGPGGEGAHGCVLKQGRAAHALVEGPVAPAGIDAQPIAHRGVLPDLVRRVHRGAGHIDLVCISPVCKRRPHSPGHVGALVRAAGHGIHDKKMLHSLFHSLLLSA